MGKLIYKSDAPITSKSEVLWPIEMDIIGDIYVKFFGKSVCALLARNDFVGTTTIITRSL